LASLIILIIIIIIIIFNQTWLEDVDEVAEDDPILEGVLVGLGQLLIEIGLNPVLSSRLLGQVL